MLNCRRFRGVAAKDNPFDFKGKSKGLSEARLLVEPESYSLTPSRRDRSMPHIRLQSFKRNSCAPRSIIHRQSRRPTECDCASLTMRGASRMTGIYRRCIRAMSPKYGKDSCERLENALSLTGGGFQETRSAFALSTILPSSVTLLTDLFNFNFCH